MTNTTIIKIEHLKSGQPSRYADSAYESRISAEWDGSGTMAPQKLNRDQALAITNQFVYPFEHEMEPRTNPSSFPFGLNAFLQFARQEGDGSWLVRVVRPFCD